MHIDCPYRTEQHGTAYCQVVSQLLDLPITGCAVSDGACQYCQRLKIAPQTPNHVVAAMSIHAAKRTGDSPFLAATIKTMRPRLERLPARQTACILRGEETRKAPCKPCQAAGGPLMVPVYACPIHKSCTLYNIGVQPKIQACSTCPDRLEKSYQLDTRPTPPAVLDAIAARKSG